MIRPIGAKQANRSYRIAFRSLWAYTDAWEVRARVDKGKRYGAWQPVVLPEGERGKNVTRPRGEKRCYSARGWMDESHVTPVVDAAVRHRAQIVRTHRQTARTSLSLGGPGHLCVPSPQGALDALGHDRWKRTDMAAMRAALPKVGRFGSGRAGPGQCVRPAYLSGENLLADTLRRFRRRSVVAADLGLYTAPPW